jgi:hypothetical protein
VQWEREQAEVRHDIVGVGDEFEQEGQKDGTGLLVVSNRPRANQMLGK